MSGGTRPIRTWLRPARFAEYSAVSAIRNSPSRSARPPGCSAPPTDTESSRDPRRALRGRDVHHQRGDPLADPLRDRAEVGLAALALPDEQDDELLAAEAPDEVALAHLGTQGVRDGGEHLITRQVAVDDR